MAVQVGGEDALAIGAALGVVHVPQAGARPGVGVALDDEGAHVGGVAVVVGDEGAVLVGAKGQGQGIERPRRSVPHEPVGQVFDPGPEGVGVEVPDPGVYAVGADDEVAPGEGVEGLDLAPEL